MMRAVDLWKAAIGIFCTIICIEATILEDPTSGSRSFSVPVQRRGPHNHLKPSISSHTSRHLASLSDSASVPLIDVYNIEYYGEIEVGQPPQKFNVLYDTGSSDFWIPGDDCSECAGKHLYNPSDSSSFVNDGQPFQITYLKGKDQGYMARDNVNWAGLKMDNIPFGVVVNGTEFDNTEFDGIVGMGLGKGNSRYPTLFDYAWKQGLLEENVFGFYLQSDPDSIDGQLILGGTNSTHYHGDIVYADVYTPGGKAPYWGIQPDHIGFDRHSPRSSSHYAIIDTGTSLIGLPAPYYRSLLALFDAVSTEDEILRVSCSADLPDFIMTINGLELHLKPEDYILQRSWDTCYLGFFSLPDMMSGSDTQIWLIGDVWIRQFYTVFDVGKLRIGFAPTNDRSSVKKRWDFITIALAVLFSLASIALCYFSVKTWYKCVFGRSNLQAQDGYHRIP